MISKCSSAFQTGLQNQLDPWLILKRGLHRERREPDGTIIAHVTDELTQRAIWREWKRVMTAIDLLDTASHANEPEREAV
jgi:hypothetical protein